MTLTESVTQCIIVIMQLTKRQAELLLLTTEMYINTSQPVGSVDLVRKLNLNISGATVRNIMADLVKMGYLKMIHVSSGRTPTELAYRYYIKTMLENAELDLLQELAIKQRILQLDNRIKESLYNSTAILAEYTNSIGFAISEDEYIIYSGIKNLLHNNLLLNANVAAQVYDILDDHKKLFSIVSKFKNRDNVSILIGKELGSVHLEPISIIFNFKVIQDKPIYLGIIGPVWQDYKKTVPIVQYISNVLKELQDYKKII